jgi:hypothetical protein
MAHLLATGTKQMRWSSTIGSSQQPDTQCICEEDVVDEEREVVGRDKY